VSADREGVRYYTGSSADRQRAAAVATPFHGWSTAAGLAAAVAAQVPDWTFTSVGLRWIATDPDSEYQGRRVIIDSGPGLATDPFNPARPRSWRPGCKVAAYAAHRETLIQLPHLTDSSDITAVIHALVALDALPPATARTSAYV
jgi:hypothetical protein